MPGFLPGTAAGVRRHHHARRQAALRLRRGHRAQGHRHHPQGLRRRLLRHGSKHIRADVNFAWPTAEIAVMGPEGAVNIVYQPRAGKAQTDRPTSPARRQKIEEFRDRFANPYVAAERGYIDAVIRPRDTRKKTHPGAGHAGRQARQKPAQEAREYSVIGGFRQKHSFISSAHIYTYNGAVLNRSEIMVPIEIPAGLLKGQTLKEWDAAAIVGIADSQRPESVDGISFYKSAIERKTLRAISFSNSSFARSTFKNVVFRKCTFRRVDLTKDSFYRLHIFRMPFCGL